MWHTVTRQDPYDGEDIGNVIVLYTDGYVSYRKGQDFLKVRFKCSCQVITVVGGGIFGHCSYCCGGSVRYLVDFKHLNLRLAIQLYAYFIF